MSMSQFASRDEYYLSKIRELREENASLRKQIAAKDKYKAFWDYAREADKMRFESYEWKTNSATGED